jgi:methionine synthase II (cobalamin-independent)
VHCCAAELPWAVLRRSAISAVSVDVGLLTAEDLDGVGELVDAGRVLMLGVVPTAVPERKPAVEEVAKAAAAVTDRLGFTRAVLRDRVGITPTCGLAGATPQWARTAVELAQKVADGIAEDPDAA